MKNEIKMTLREIKNYVKIGRAIDLTNAPENQIPSNYERIAYSTDVYGVNGVLIEDTETKQLYAVTSRSTNLFRII